MPLIGWVSMHTLDSLDPQEAARFGSEIIFSHNPGTMSAQIGIGIAATLDHARKASQRRKFKINVRQSESLFKPESNEWPKWIYGVLHAIFARILQYRHTKIYRFSSKNTCLLLERHEHCRWIMSILPL